MTERTITEVVAGLIWEGDRFLVCQRPENKKRGLLWEFAGGKVEPGETKEEALRRECREELDIDLDVGEEFMTVTHEYPDLTVRLTLFSARIRAGEPKLLEHAAMKWITAGETDSLAFCPADTVILERLKTFAGRVRTAEAGGAVVHLLLPSEGEPDTTVWIHEDFVSACRVRELLRTPGVAVAAVGGIDWDDCLSPWPAPKIFRGGRDFSGGGPRWLETLTDTVIPAAEAGLSVKRRILAGYSLAGLFALWAVCLTDRFDGCAAVSGSFWYDGFADWMAGRTPYAARIALSVGDREKNTKNARMARVEDAARRIADDLRSRGIDASFSLNPGGHFRDVPERIARGIAAVLGDGTASG